MAVAQTACWACRYVTVVVVVVVIAVAFRSVVDVALDVQVGERSGGRVAVDQSGEGQGRTGFAEGLDEHCGMVVEGRILTMWWW